MKILFTLTLIISPIGMLLSQQIADTTFNPVVLNPMYKSGLGPVIFIDEGHHNRLTKDGNYMPFAKLLQRDGYVVKKYMGAFSKENLKKGKVLVIANAINKVNLSDGPSHRVLPNPSAFTPEEIEIVRDWVFSGGSLMLIADHMPLAGAAEDLALAFGFKFSNGFSFDVVSPSYFRLIDRTISENEITTGRDSTETVTEILKSEGSAFQIPDDATSILIFNQTSMLIMPDTVWRFNSKAPLIEIAGWSQGAYKLFGKGKVAVFGEASMFSAQLQGVTKRKMGMNRDDAKDNPKLLLNVIHWLDGKL